MKLSRELFIIILLSLFIAILFLGMLLLGLQTVLFLRTTNTSSLEQIGIFNGSTPGKSIVVHGRYAYFIDEEGLKILDMSDPTDPREIGHYYMNGCGNVVVKDAFAYVTRGEQEVIILNITNPSIPNKVSQMEGSNGSVELVVQESWAYVASASYSILVYNISDSTNPSLVNYFSNSAGYKHISALFIQEPYAYIGYKETGVYLNYSNNFLIVDISNHSNLKQVGGFSYSHYEYFNRIYDIFVQGSYAFLGMDIGLRVLNVSNPRIPTEIEHYGVNIDDFTSSNFTHIVINDSLVYMVNNFSGRIFILDASNPTSLKELYYDKQAEALISGITVNGSYIYVIKKRNLFIYTFRRGIFSNRDPPSIFDPNFWLICHNKAEPKTCRIQFL